MSRTGQSKTRPTFINVGPGRCATSWLHEILMAHPDITTARVKETEYFNSNFHMGDDWYCDQFPDEGKQVAGEISNCYYIEPTVAQRIHDFDPDMRIIFNVRDPYHLVQSFYGFGVRRGLDLPPLEESLDKPFGRFMGSGFSYREKRKQLNQGDVVPLLESVMLSRYLKTFLERFPRSQIYLMVFERLKTERAQVLKEIYDFVGVKSDFVPPVANEIVNASITPKSKAVARLATTASYVLRRIGAFGLLSRLHQSRLIKKLFYSDVKSTKGDKVDPRSVLDPEVCIELDDEMLRMIQLCPELENWWVDILPVRTELSSPAKESVV